MRTLSTFRTMQIAGLCAFLATAASAAQTKLTVSESAAPKIQRISQLPASLQIKLVENMGPYLTSPMIKPDLDVLMGEHSQYLIGAEGTAQLHYSLQGLIDQVVGNSESPAPLAAAGQTIRFLLHPKLDQETRAIALGDIQSVRYFGKYPAKALERLAQSLPAIKNLMPLRSREPLDPAMLSKIFDGLVRTHPEGVAEVEANLRFQEIILQRTSGDLMRDDVYGGIAAVVSEKTRKPAPVILRQMHQVENDGVWEGWTLPVAAAIAGKRPGELLEDYQSKNLSSHPAGALILALAAITRKPLENVRRMYADLHQFLSGPDLAVLTSFGWLSKDSGVDAGRLRLLVRQAGSSGADLRDQSILVGTNLFSNLSIQCLMEIYDKFDLRQRPNGAFFLLASALSGQSFQEMFFKLFLYNMEDSPDGILLLTEAGMKTASMNRWARIFPMMIETVHRASAPSAHASSTPH